MPHNLSPVFDKVYRRGEWGVGSGEGSDPALAAPYIQYLQCFLVEKNIGSVLDCGCGDLQIASAVDWGSVTYHGIDVSSEALKLAAQHARPGLTVEQASILDRDWHYDLALVKEVFQHLSFRNIDACIKRLSGCRYLLITDDVPGSRSDIHDGEYRPLDLLKWPFHLRAKVVLEYSMSTHKRVLLVEN